MSVANGTFRGELPLPRSRIRLIKWKKATNNHLLVTFVEKTGFFFD